MRHLTFSKFWSVKRIVPPKKWPSFEKKNFASNEVSHVADVVVQFYSCATCVKGVLVELSSTTIHQYLGNVCKKIALLKSFNFVTSKEPNSFSFWATGLIMVPKEAEFFDPQSTREFFFRFSNSGKKHAVWNFSFLCKNAFFWKKKLMFILKTKMKFEKKLYRFVEHKIPLRLMWVSTV